MTDDFRLVTDDLRLVTTTVALSSAHALSPCWPSSSYRSRSDIRSGAGEKEAAVPDPPGSLQTHEPRAGRKGRRRTRREGRLRRHDARRLQAGCRQDRSDDAHAVVPRAVRRPDADDERRPAAHARSEEGD